MHYDVIIIGAGMSGLAAGIRLAMFDKRVCILERHYAYGGLNSYYNLNGRSFDVGLHAVTNYVAPSVTSGPLPKLLRQLRLSRDDFELCEQRVSEIRFPGRTLRFSNDPQMLLGEVAREFPGEADAFVRFFAQIQELEYSHSDPKAPWARAVLGDVFGDPLLIEMLLCPTMYYGSPCEHDMEFADFTIIFRSIFCEGFARPKQGVRGILKPLVRRYRACGGKLRMQCGVQCINVDGSRVEGVTLASGEQLSCDTLLSSAGWDETMRLCGAEARDEQLGPASRRLGRLSFVETFLVLDRTPADLGWDTTIAFFNDTDTFAYQCPTELVDVRSGVACCPNNYDRHDHLPEGLFRLTWLANHSQWASMNRADYNVKKGELLEQVISRAERFLRGVRAHVVFTDMFTPRTIEAFTGHVGGAVYGRPCKARDGRTHLENLFLCGTDQGYVGIIGALMSGVMMANLHVLSE